MKLTKKKAIELSILKWEWIVKNNGELDFHELIKEIPELSKVLSSCGLCEKYIENREYDDWCNGCPICIYGKENESHGCTVEKHPWMIWTDNRTKINAQTVLNLIKSIK
ncbi:hypothetical protein KAR91_25735 [Candidatus Pacearchaeota archaeon]|nr:hypothetical protein [Candidatus Pacearchaeota archaeon]